MNSGSVEQVATADFPTRWGQFRIHGFRGTFGGEKERRIEEAVALVMGDVHGTPPLVRIHSQCLTGDVFGSLRCDCRQQLEMALQLIATDGAGVLIYDKVAALDRAGVTVVERVPCEVPPTALTAGYLKTKKEKMGHLFSER